MELVAPAGNLRKLKYAFAYGADSVYIGLKNFSLRAKADNFFNDEYEEIARLKANYAKAGNKKKILAAVNISFHNADLKELKTNLTYFKNYPIDAFIVSDLGIVKILQKHFPNTPLHLSTQANCTNLEAVKVYKSLGFSRIVLAREVSLKEIAEIKDAVPDIQLECFVHGSMCMAYSGRCLLSAFLAGRNANAGACAQTCRWNYKLLAKQNQKDKDFFYRGQIHEALQNNAINFAVEESERLGEYFPIVEGENYTSIFSSKDLCMIDWLAKMKSAGVDAIKIEGRMKSLYYVALTTRAYRKKLDVLDGKISEEKATPFIKELYNTQHRDFSTGFYFSSEDANAMSKSSSTASYLLMGTLGKKLENIDGKKRFIFNSMNKLEAGTEIEFIGPDVLAIKDCDYKLLEPENLTEMDWVAYGHNCIIETSVPAEENFIVRTKAKK